MRMNVSHLFHSYEAFINEPQEFIHRYLCVFVPGLYVGSSYYLFLLSTPPKII